MYKEQYNAIISEVVDLIKSKDITYSQAQQILESAIRVIGNVKINSDSLKEDF